MVNVQCSMKTNLLVIHVKGQRSREAFIEQQLAALDMPYSYILDGNKEDLTPEILDTWFSGEMHSVGPAASCTNKHLLACQHIVDNDLDGALIIEDDLRFYSRFKNFFMKSLDEIRTLHADEPLIANYEESSLMLVPRSKRIKGKVLHLASRDRFAGCYYVNRTAALTILSFVREHKTDVPIDRLHSLLTEKGLINYYWSYPCLACQCSCDGTMPTMIPTRPRPLKRLKWLYKRIYKHLLYSLR